MAFQGVYNNIAPSPVGTLSNNLVLRMPSVDGKIQLQNAAANNILTYDTLTTKWNTPYNLTVSGTIAVTLTPTFSNPFRKCVRSFLILFSKIAYFTSRSECELESSDGSCTFSLHILSALK